MTAFRVHFALNFCPSSSRIVGFLFEIAFIYLNVSDRNNSREQRRIRSIHHSGVSSSADTLNKGHILDPDHAARVRVNLTRNWTGGWLRYVNWIFSVIFVFVQRVFNTKNWRKINDPNVLRNEWNSWKRNENNGIPETVSSEKLSRAWWNIWPSICTLVFERSFETNKVIQRAIVTLLIISRVVTRYMGSGIKGLKKGWDSGSQPRDLGSEPPGSGSAVFFIGSRIRRSG